MAQVEPIPSIDGRRRYQILSPVDGTPLGDFECADDRDVAEALAVAREAQVAWGRASFEARAEVMTLDTSSVAEDSHNLDESAEISYGDGFDIDRSDANASRSVEADDDAMDDSDDAAFYDNDDGGGATTSTVTTMRWQ